MREEGVKGVDCSYICVAMRHRQNAYKTRHAAVFNMKYASQQVHLVAAGSWMQLHSVHGTNLTHVSLQCFLPPQPLPVFSLQLAPLWFICESQHLHCKVSVFAFKVFSQCYRAPGRGGEKHSSKCLSIWVHNYVLGMAKACDPHLAPL